MIFPLRTGAYRYRTLRLGLKGWDCLAFQSCLVAVGYPLPRFGPDGYFGQETDTALRRFQEDFGLAIDGKAGPVSQRIAVVTIIKGVSEAHNLPKYLEEGQVEHESSYLAGNYTPPYGDETRDLGIVMLHKSVNDANCRLCFDAPNRLEQLAAFLRARHNLYYGQPGAKTHRRAWELASGAWNAPAWTDTLARGGTLKPHQLEHITAYWEDCTAYVTEWTE